MMFRRFLIAALALMLSLPGLCQENPSRAVRDSLLFEGRYRTHYLYMPSRLREGRPLVIMLHGYGGKADGVRIATGDILTGKAVGEDGYIGFFDDTVTIIREGTEKEWFGWALPIRWKQYSADHSYFSWLMPWRKYEMDTNLHGGPRAFVMNDSYYSRVLPMDGIFPTYLIKACLAGDIDKMEKFGIYQVLPEDFALCEYVDPSKNYIQDIIAQGIDLMLKEMA